MLSDQALQRPAGGQPDNNNRAKDKTNINNVNNRTERPTGNSREAGLRRLRKDRPDLLEEVVTGKKTTNAAVIEAGFWITPIQINPVDPEKAVKSLIKYCQWEDYKRFCGSNV